jgi:hypothetical protein
MKRRFHQNCLLVLVWIISFSTVYVTAYSQDEVAQVSGQPIESTQKLPKACLKQTISDTILPTISNSGRGLLHCENLSIGADRNNCQAEGRNKSVTRVEYFTESELNILREQQLRMDEQYHIELEKQIRKDKLDLQLGEIFKGFYMNPPF